MRMYKKSKKSEKAIFGSICNISQENKVRLAWLVAAVFMVGIFFLWVEGVKENFSQMAGQKLMDASVLPEFPEMPDLDINKTIVDGSKRLNDALRKSDEELKAVGDAYIREKGIFADEEYSSLKFTDAEIGEEEITLTYSQYYKDIPVQGCGLVLSAAMDGGDIVEKSNTLVTGIELEIDPKISLKTAGDLAKKETGDGNFAFKEGDLVIVRHEEEFYLAWRIVLAAETEGNVYKQEVLVGANHVNIISRTAFDELSDVAE